MPTNENNPSHPMFDAIYTMRDKIDRVKAIEAEQSRTTAAFDAAQKTIADKQERGESLSSEDIERKKEAMDAKFEKMTVIEEIGACSVQIASLNTDYEKYCADNRDGVKAGRQKLPMASQALREIADVMQPGEEMR